MRFLWLWICYWCHVGHLESDSQVCERIAKKGCALPGNTVKGVLCIEVGGIWLVVVTAIVRQQEVSKLQGHLCPVICNTIHSCFQKEIFNVLHLWILAHSCLHTAELNQSKSTCSCSHRPSESPLMWYFQATV